MLELKLAMTVKGSAMEYRGPHSKMVLDQGNAIRNPLYQNMKIKNCQRAFHTKSDWWLRFVYV